MTVRSRPHAPLPPPTEQRPSLLEQYRSLAAERAEAITAGHTERAAGLEGLMALIEKQHRGEQMPTTTDITKTLREGLGVIKSERAALDARIATGEVNDRFAASERDRLRRGARALEETALARFSEIAIEQESEARAKRAEAAATRDPMTVYAADYQRLIASPRDGGSLLDEALFMLDNRQPERASFLLQVAADKGARPDSLLRSRIEDALDATDPARKEARAIEDDLARASTEFGVARLSALADAGFGVSADGSIGEGSPSEIAAASVHAKTLAYAAGVREFPVGDGSNG